MSRISIEWDSDEEEPEPDRMSLSMPATELRSLSSGTDGSLGSADRLEKSSSASSLSKAETVETCRPLPLRPATNPGEALRSIDTPDTLSTDLATTLALPDQSSRARKGNATAHRTLPSPDATARMKSEPFQFPSSNKANGKVGMAKESVLKDQNGNTSERHTFMKSKSLDSGSSRSNSSFGEEGELEEPRKEEVIEELHIYLLSLSSPFLMHLRSSWNNYIVVSADLPGSRTFLSVKLILQVQC